MFFVAILSSAFTVMLLSLHLSESGPVVDLLRVPLPVSTLWEGGLAR